VGRKVVEIYRVVFSVTLGGVRSHGRLWYEVLWHFQVVVVSGFDL